MVTTEYNSWLEKCVADAADDADDLSGDGELDESVDEKPSRSKKSKSKKGAIAPLKIKISKKKKKKKTSSVSTRSYHDDQVIRFLLFTQATFNPVEVYLYRDVSRPN